MEKIKVGILMGGRSAEHEVSLLSGEEVFGNIDVDRFSPKKFLINKDGSFQFDISELQKVDVVFIALHGQNGEDGSIQGFLETLKVPFTGSGVRSSSLGMDKYLSRQLWDKEDLPVIPQRLVKSAEECEEFDFPYVLKPRAEGSSVAVNIVENNSKVAQAFNEAAQYGQVLLEKYIEGKELTVGVINKGNRLQALPSIEIIPSTGFYDYEAKYIREDTQYIVPADLDRNDIKRLEETSIKACEVLGIDTYSRADFMYDDGAVYLMEVNTLPGMTSHSLLPKAAEAEGISYKELISMIIDLAL